MGSIGRENRMKEEILGCVIHIPFLPKGREVYLLMSTNMVLVANSWELYRRELTPMLIYG